MSDAAFRFLSWLRRGAASELTTPDLSAGPAHAVLPVAVELNSGAHVASVSLALHGPGDVVAFDPRAVVRTWPAPGAVDAEPNYFPLVELDQVDLPWRYTPRAAHATGRLRPWLALIVLRDDEHAYTPPRADRPLGAVTVAAGTPLPRPDQGWAWSHGQISGDDGAPVPAVVRDQPARCVARLLSPRRLAPSTSYWAMLVPVFEAGRRGGLRLPLGGAAAALTDAWTLDASGRAATAVELPVYHRWRFATGAGGDFESLVRALVPGALPATVGLRTLDVAQPGAGLPAAASAPLQLGGALAAPATTPAPWPAAERAAFIAALAPLLDLPAVVRAAGGDPVVAPPLYGTWHARRDRLGPPPWFQLLNEDPRHRVAAALGTAVVQASQQALMEQAWQQVAGIRELNQQLRAAQLARAVGVRLHARMLVGAEPDVVLALTAAVHGHVRGAAQSIRALAVASPPRRALMSPAFRRLLRPLGPLGRRQGRPDLDPAPVIDRVNAGAYAAALHATPPALADVPTHGWVEGTGAPWKWPRPADEIASAPPRPGVVVWDPIYGDKPPRDPGPRDTDSPSMGRFRAAVFQLAELDRTLPDGPVLHQLDLPLLRDRLVEELDPAHAIPASFAQRLHRDPGLPLPRDPIEPAMAYPELPQPMYAPLAALSPDWVLPGLADVPASSVSLAVTNPPFVEAFLVGLNHELARELLWSEYPTDQRGSYFRQFWDPAGLAPTPVPETAKDITQLHTWPPASQLGAHSPRPAPPDPEGRHVVLLVRSELLRRYPGTLVYAQRAQGPAGSRTLADEQRAPVFAGRLPPDVAFFGFDLSVEQARGGGADPGWFFVFAEQPGEPRFGLDVAATTPPATWNDLAWSHLDVAPGAYIDLAVPRPALAALELPGGPAWHVVAAGPGRPFARGADHAAITLQRPVRIAVHATEMLP